MTLKREHRAFNMPKWKVSFRFVVQHNKKRRKRNERKKERKRINALSLHRSNSLRYGINAVFFRPMFFCSTCLHQASIHATPCSSHHRLGSTFRWFLSFFPSSFLSFWKLWPIRSSLPSPTSFVCLYTCLSLLFAVFCLPHRSTHPVT